MLWYPTVKKKKCNARKEKLDTQTLQSTRMGDHYKHKAEHNRAATGQDVCVRSIRERLACLIGQTVTVVTQGTSPVFVSAPGTAATTLSQLSPTLTGTLTSVDCGTLTLTNTMITVTITQGTGSRTPTTAPLVPATQPVVISLCDVIALSAASLFPTPSRVCC